MLFDILLGLHGKKSSLRRVSDHAWLYRRETYWLNGYKRHKDNSSLFLIHLQYGWRSLPFIQIADANRKVVTYDVVCSMGQNRSGRKNSAVM